MPRIGFLRRRQVAVVGRLAVPLRRAFPQLFQAHLIQGALSVGFQHLSGGLGLALGRWGGGWPRLGLGVLRLEPNFLLLRLEIDLNLGFVTGTWFWVGLGLKLTV